MMAALNQRLNDSGDPDGFFTGCAVSPFKYTEAECFAQYAKLQRKVAAGAQFIITQLGYDARKFQELLLFMQKTQIQLPVLGSIYVLTPASARIMHSGKVPGATVSKKLLNLFLQEWRDFLPDFDSPETGNISFRHLFGWPLCRDSAQSSMPAITVIASFIAV